MTGKLPRDFISIKLQHGPIIENGVNGCQVDDVITFALAAIHHFNTMEAGKYSCRENAMAITKLDEALLWLGKRTADREARGVEGTNEV